MLTVDQAKAGEKALFLALRLLKTSMGAEEFNSSPIVYLIGHLFIESTLHKYHEPYEVFPANDG